MDLRVITAGDIERLMSIDAATAVLSAAFSGPDGAPPMARERLPFADGELLVMTAAGGANAGHPVAEVKVVTVRNANHDIGEPAVQAAYILFGGASLAPLALIDGTALTAFRTAAVSALATRLLACEGAEKLVVFGAGVQAAAHLGAMTSVRPIREVVIVNKDAERAQRMLGIARSLGLAARRGDASDVSGGDIVCTCTTSPAPVFDGSLLTPGTHVNAVGSYHSDTRELDDVTAIRGRWFVEERAQVAIEAGDVIIPVSSGIVSADFIVGDLYDLCAGTAGRTDASEITVFKSVGVALEDLAIAEALVRAGPG